MPEEKIRAVIVDDDPTMRRILAEALRMRGYDIEIFANAGDCLEYTKHHSVTMAVLDKKLPDMNGLDLCREIRKLPQGGLMFVLMITGSEAPDHLTDALAAGVNDYLLKPFSLKSLDVRLTIAEQTINARLGRRAAENSLLEREQFLAAMLEAMPAPVFYKDRNLRYLGCNEAFERFFGKKRSDIVGKDMSELLPDNPGVFYDKMDQKLIENEVSQIYESKLRDAEGKVHDVVFQKDVFRDRSGRVAGIIGVILDVTERKEMEQQLRQAEKMQAIGQLAGGVAHDFNNCLSGILGFAQVIEEDAGDEKIVGYAGRIVRSSRRARDMVSQLLAFAREGHPSIQPVDVHELIDEVNLFIDHSLDKRITVVRELTAKSAVIVADASQIQNALLNIAINARDAMPDGGRMVFRTSECVVTPDESAARPYRVEPGNYLKIGISDTGTGMDAETLRHIYEPFFTTKRRQGGTGMGLAVVYGVVKRHRGFIEVESAVGKGSVFEMYFPLSEENPQKNTGKKESGGAVRGLKTLVIDDEEDVRVMMQAALARDGHAVHTCADGMEAIDYLEKNPCRVDLVILDMVMPRLGGKDTFFAMRKLRPHVKTIVCSGYNQNDEVRLILDAGDAAFMSKPFDIAEFRRVVREFAGRD